MPYLVNGIGTTYYGKKNLEEKSGTCSKCGRNVKLQSYESRLWFVILLIPIVPLGKKMILDYCKHCTYHKAISIKKWESLKEENLSKGKEEMASNPNDLETVIQMHSKLAFFNKQEEAETLAKNMSLQFKDNLDVQLYLGNYYDQLHQVELADKCLERALSLEPNNHVARRAVALGCINKNELARAGDLISYMRFSGPDQDAGVLYALATALQENGNHAEARSYFEIIARDFPNIAKNDKTFRKAVKKSNHALGDSHEYLPKQEFISSKNLKRVAVVIGVLTISVFILNWYFTSHQSLYVVNQLKTNAIITLPGKNAIPIKSGEQTNVIIPEGEHSIIMKIQNQQEENISVNISNSFYHRFFPDKIHIFNVGRGAVLIWEQTTYSEKPSQKDPYKFKFYAGDAFLTIPKVDYLFVPFPETISLPDGSPVLKTRLSIFEAAPSELLNVLQFNGLGMDKIINYIEAHLNTLQGDETLLTYYIIYAQLPGILPRAMQFLEKGLTKRPVQVEWHRTYQTLSKLSLPKEKLISQYDAMLEKEPQNSDLLYLRGRLESIPHSSFDFYNRSISANKNNPYPYAAKAFHMALSGDFQAARPLLETAFKLDPKSFRISDFYYRLRFALGEYDALKKEYQPLFEKNSYNEDYLSKSLFLNIIQKDSKSALDTLKKYNSAVKNEFPEDSKQLILKAQIQLDYLQADFPMLITHSAQLDNEFSQKDNLKIAYLYQGNMDKLEELIEDKSKISGYICLLYWLGWLEEGDQKKAESWIALAIKNFEASPSDEKVIGALLRNPGKEILPQLDYLGDELENKRILYTSFAKLYPPFRQELLSKAEKLNYFPTFPYHFLTKINNKMKNRR